MDLDTKQIVGQLFLGIGALGIVLAPGLAGISAESRATDQSPEMTTRSLNVKQEQSEPAESDELARYESAQFRVDYPKEWRITPQGDDGVAIVSIANGVNMPIRTDIVMLREDPQTAVPQRLDQLVAEAVSVQRYSMVAVDGQSGLRIWYAPETGQRALITFVGYGNEQTVVLSSQYPQGTDVEEAEELVTQIHGSFVNHSVARASTP